MDQLIEVKGSVVKLFKKYSEAEAAVEVAEANLEALKEAKSNAVKELVETCGSKKFLKDETLMEVRQRGETYFFVRKGAK